MITRIYVDNYKCLVNFEYKPRSFELIIGTNGAGKTTVFEVLDKIRLFISGKSDALQIFRRRDGTKWINKSNQIFELDFIYNSSGYSYRLEINTHSSDCRVEKEIVRRDGLTIFESEWRDKPPIRKPPASGLTINSRPTSVPSYDDDFDDSDPFADEYEPHIGQTRAAIWGDVKAEYLLSDPNQSIASITWLGIKDIMGAVLNSQIIRINPFSMTSQVSKPQPRPENDMSNFPSYYLYLLQQRQGLMFDMIPSLRDAIDGFDSFVVQEDFELGRRELNVAIKHNKGKKISYDLNELSDGQRVLIVLYTLVFCALDAETTLIIDEPENYVALREIQPLIHLMGQRIEESGGQILLISHSREFINLLSDEGKCVRLYRENGGHTRIAEFNPDYDQTGLTGGEIIARGWEDDEKR